MEYYTVYVYVIILIINYSSSIYLSIYLHPPYFVKNCSVLQCLLHACTWTIIMPYQRYVSLGNAQTDTTWRVLRVGRNVQRK